VLFEVLRALEVEVVAVEVLEKRFWQKAKNGRGVMALLGWWAEWIVLNEVMLLMMALECERNSCRLSRFSTNLRPLSRRDLILINWLVGWALAMRLLL